MGTVLCILKKTLEVTFLPRDDNVVFGFDKFWKASRKNWWKISQNTCHNFLGREKVAINVALFFIVILLIIYSPLAASNFDDENEINPRDITPLDILNIVFVCIILLLTFLYFLFFYTGFFNRLPKFQTNALFVQLLPIACLVYISILLIMFITYENTNIPQLNLKMYPFHPAIFLTVAFFIYIFYLIQYIIHIKQKIKMPKILQKNIPTRSNGLQRQSGQRNIFNQTL